MQILSWLLPPLLGAVIAFSTNWIAIIMLFRPHREKRLFGFRIPFTPGLIPRERARLGRKLGEAVSTHLLTHEVLTQALSDPKRWALPDYSVAEALEKWGGENSLDTLLPKAAEFVRAFPEKFPALDEKLAELTRHVVKENLSGFASLFVNKDKVYENIKTGLADYLDDENNREALREKLRTLNIRDTLNALPLHRALAFLAAHIAQKMPIADMIEQKMAAYDVAEAESMILSVVGRELKIIVMLGGVFGFLIGLLSLVAI